MKLKTLEDIPNESKVFVRVDFDVSFNDDMTIDSPYRIDRCLTTIDTLFEKKCSIVLGTKLGKPEKIRISTRRILDYLKTKLSSVEFVEDYSGSAAKSSIEKLQSGSILLLENLRFFDEETSNNEMFAQQFSELFDCYVNEAFAMCHRNETSMTLLPKYLPSFAGLNLLEEVKTLDHLKGDPDRPFTVVIGGAKGESKLPVIDSFKETADRILIGGKLVQDPLVVKYKDIERVVLADLTEDTFDIDQATITLFSNQLKMSKTIIVVGPMGKFEDEASQYGTKEILTVISKSDAYKVAGGGDTIAAIEKFSTFDSFDFVSTGGGAMLAFLAGEKLTALQYVMK